MFSFLKNRFKSSKANTDGLSNIGTALTRETNLSSLLEMILKQAQDISNADSGAVYLIRDDILKFEVMMCGSLDIHLGGSTRKVAPMAPISLYKEGKPNVDDVVAHAALSRETISIDDLHCDTIHDFSETKAFDDLRNYESKSMLCVPLISRKNVLVGVLQLVNAQKRRGSVVSFTDDDQHLIESLASLASVAIANQKLIDEQEALLQGIVKLLALAIDAKSAHTAKHCQAIPEIVKHIAKAACEEKEGYFASFDLNDSQWEELEVAAWLHDCGKLTTPPHILEKETKLHALCDRIELIKTRLEVLLRDAEIRYLRNEIELDAYEEEKRNLNSDYRFLQQINKGAEFMEEKSLERLDEIAKYRWQPQIGYRKIRYQPFFSLNEYECLSVRKGTLTKEEREIVNNHIVMTIEMLESLPFPDYLKNVPEYAGGHHEKMDGSGFPNGLKRDEMSIPARMMAVADIFEALTSSERPYKKTMTLSQALSIMADMKKANHIDPDIFDLFIRRKVYAEYAEKHLMPEQIDAVDTKELLS